MSGHIFSVEEVAQRLKLKRKNVGGKVRYVGANPTGSGATKDGFTLFPEGNAMDNNGTNYTSPEVARFADIEPNQYAPVVAFAENNLRKIPTANETFDWTRAETFNYVDEGGALLFQVGRIGSGAIKKIRQRRPDGSGDWLNSLGDVRRVLYNLPEVLTAHTTLLVEGEKCVEAVNSELLALGAGHGFAATTNPGGALKWRVEFAETLAGKTVYVLPDNDEKGEQHARQIWESFQSLPQEKRPARLCRVDLPNLPEKGDAADFFASGGHLGELLELAEAAPSWNAEPEPLKAPRFESYSFADLERLPRPLWLVEGLLVEHTTSILSADSGSFKSFFALDLALCIATGREFHGRKVKQAAVVYVAAEGFFTLRDRATAWARFHGVALPENVHIVPVPINLSEKGTLTAFAAQISAFQPGLVVLDTLSQNALGTARI